MTQLGEHFSRAGAEARACTSDHADDFAGLVQGYHDADAYLTERLAADITPERIFLGGSITPIGMIVNRQ